LPFGSLGGSLFSTSSRLIPRSLLTRVASNPSVSAPIRCRRKESVRRRVWERLRRRDVRVDAGREEGRGRARVGEERIAL